MRKTKLIQFQNQNNQTLRGVLVSEEGNEKLAIMLGGFERKATTEKKFKKLSDELASKGVDCFRFDYEGVGLSDGDFSDITVKGLENDFFSVLEKVKEIKGYKNIYLVAHSVSGCVAALAKEKTEKQVLIGPALNQKDLLRFYFVKSKMKKEEPQTEITWDNYKDYLDEKEFEREVGREGKMTKENYVLPDYFKENHDKDYSEYYSGNENVLLVQGDNDDKVPAESINATFKDKIIVKGGDHDLERPDLIDQWLEGVTNYLTE